MLKSLKHTYSMIFQKVSVFITLVFFFILLSFFDLLGIGIITNFISIIVNQGSDKLIFIDISNLFLSDYSLQDKIKIYSLSILIIFLVKNLLSIYFNYYVLNFSLKFSEKMRIQIINKLFLLRYQRITLLSNAELLKIIGENVANFEGVIQSIIKLTSDVILVFSIIILLSFIDLKSLVVVSVIIIIFIYLFNSFYLSKLKKMGKDVNQNIEILFDNLSYSLKGYKELVALKKTNFIKNRYINAAKQIKDNRLKQKIISILPRHILEFIVIAFICFYVLVFQFFNKDFSLIIPILAAFSIAAIRLIPIFNQILSSINILKFSDNSIQNINSFLTYEEIQDFNSIQHDYFNNIEFENVSYKHESSDKNQINDLNLCISANQYIGIKGESGSGKTTFLNLFVGFLNPTSGLIKINNKKDLSLINNFNSLLAYIPQDITIIKDTIARNISLSQSLNTDSQSRIMKICIDLGLCTSGDADNFLNKVLEENGANISGGQRQRIGIARALFHNRKILILDEITSSLDVGSQRKTLDILDKLKGNLTILFVSHKKNSFESCDNIYEIKDGKFIKQNIN